MNNEQGQDYAQMGKALRNQRYLFATIQKNPEITTWGLDGGRNMPFATDYMHQWQFWTKIAASNETAISQKH